MLMKFRCKQCNQPGKRQGFKRQFCSNKCRDRYFYLKTKKLKVRLCITCKERFEPRQGWPVDYCSSKCKPLDAICKGCSNPFTKKTKEQKYCTYECYLKTSCYKNVKRIRCLECNKTFETTPSRKSYCTRRCASKANLAESMVKLNENPAANIFSMRWAVLYKMRPDLHELMLKIENRIGLNYDGSAAY